MPGMAVVLLRRVGFLRSITNSHFSSRFCRFCSSRNSTFFGPDRGHSVTDRLHLSPLFSEVRKDDVKDCKIELVDDVAWRVSSGLAEAWRGKNEDKAVKLIPGFGGREDDGDGVISSVDSGNEDPDFDDVVDMRIRGRLFYKLDKDSREYQEYKFDFHRKNSAKNDKNRKESKEKKKKGNPSQTLASRVEKTSKNNPPREIKKKKEIQTKSFLPFDKNTSLIYQLHEVGDACSGKKKRTPTFNQLTAPYHEPFCLDIFISKGSVRASIIHRATSKVVVVSDSISKDLKFDLGSTKSRSACAAVGEVLAQRALADDIHNVVYTPRKGDKLEGKFHVVLKSITDGGVDVKVKLKQKKMKRARGLPQELNIKIEQGGGC